MFNVIDSSAAIVQFNAILVYTMICTVICTVGLTSSFCNYLHSVLSLNMHSAVCLFYLVSTCYAHLMLQILLKA
jgi:hypothetical protein